MRKIPEKLKKRLTGQPCALRNDKFGACTGRIQLHHVWIYAGRQINEPWAILGACEGHHERVKQERRVKEAFEKISLEYATLDQLAKYPRKEWKQLKKYLKVY